jgi:hypothetical protein
MRFPASLTLIPQENQFTEALAWLVDRSHVFSRSLVELFLQEGDALMQPDAYIAAWRQCLPELEATVRRVGTLTRGFEFAGPSDAMRARDVCWHEISELLAAEGAKDTLEPQVRQVAEDYREVINERVLGMGDLPPPGEVAALLAWGRKVLGSFAKELPVRVRAKPGMTTQKEDFCAQTFRVTSPAAESTQLWIAFTPRGARYNTFGMPDAVHVRIEDPKKPDPLRVLAGGFEVGQDLKGYTFFGRSLEVAELADDVGHAGALLAEWVADSVKACDPPLA